LTTNHDWYIIELMKPFKNLKAAIVWLRSISGSNAEPTKVGVLVIQGRSEQLYDFEMNAFGGFKYTRIM
jgi:hypothetical protein